MPVHVEWYDDTNLIVLSTFLGDVDRTDVEEALATYLNYLDNADRLVHFIADMRSFGKVNGFALNDLKPLRQLMQHPRMGYSVVVGAKPLVHFVLKVLVQTFRLRYALFGDVEEGARYLREVIRIHGYDKIKPDQP